MSVEGYPYQPAETPLPVPPPAAPPDGRSPLVRAFGERGLRRPAPRFGVTVAAAGVALAYVGALVISGDKLVSGASSSSDDGGGLPNLNRAPGILLSLAIVLVGGALLVVFRRGPLAAAGVAATILGLPPLIFFAGFDVHAAGDPFPLAAIFGISFVVWLVLYVLPPTRGHSAHLAAAALSLWLFVLEQIKDLFIAVVTAAFEPIAAAFTGDDSSHGPNLDGLGTASLIFGLIYLALAGLLARRGLIGSSTALVPAAIAALALSIVFFAGSFGTKGSGVYLAVLGVLLAVFGASSERRFSTWLGGGALAYGLAVVVADSETGATSRGLTLIVIGVVLVVLALVVARAWGEPDETVPGPSRLRLRVSPLPAPQPYPGYPPPEQQHPGYPPPEQQHPGYPPPDHDA